MSPNVLLYFLKERIARNYHLWRQPAPDSILMSPETYMLVKRGKQRKSKGGVKEMIKKRGRLCPSTVCLFVRKNFSIFNTFFSSYVSEMTWLS